LGSNDETNEGRALKFVLSRPFTDPDIAAQAVMRGEDKDYKAAA